MPRLDEVVMNIQCGMACIQNMNTLEDR